MNSITHFASMSDFEKGGVEIIGNDEPSRYLFSNMFEVASNSKPWERVIVAKNIEFTIECTRTIAGVSSWYLCGHDETALVMQGEVEILFLKPDTIFETSSLSGATKLEKKPTGQTMGKIKMRRGHLALLPANAAYRFRSVDEGVLLIQSMEGPESAAKWREICQN